MNTPRVLAVGLTALACFSAPAAAQQESSWLDRVDVFATARLRAEFNDNLNPASDRHRIRGNFRIGATVDLSEDFDAGFRFTTGNPDDPNSPHFDFGGTGGAGNDGEFDSFEMNLDQIYLTWAPSGMEGFSVTGGKFSNPMHHNPIYGNLLWDDDVQPEGVQVVWDCPYNDDTFSGIGASLGQYIIQENGSAEDIWSTFAQVYAAADMGDAGKLNFALAYYFVGDTSPDGAVSPLLDDNQGNAVTATDFVSQFGTLNPMVVWTLADWTVAAEFFNNLRAADGQEDTGYSLGAAVATPYGKFYADYITMGQDAHLSPWSQDDFLLNSNAVNTVIGWKKPLTKRINLHVWLLASEADDPSLGGPDDMVYRFRTDLNIAIL
ncbi:MAG: putative porin [Planctomycetota bacterium]|nr:putative porin [Planctomycetota bacterium]